MAYTCIALQRPVLTSISKRYTVVTIPSIICYCSHKSRLPICVINFHQPLTNTTAFTQGKGEVSYPWTQQQSAICQTANALPPEPLS